MTASCATASQTIGETIVGQVKHNTITYIWDDIYSELVLNGKEA